MNTLYPESPNYRVLIKYCVYEDFKIYSGLWPLSVSPSVSVCVHNGRENTSPTAELAEFRKITTFYGKTQYLMNSLYLVYIINV